jgi:hypothetical protein
LSIPAPIRGRSLRRDGTRNQQLNYSRETLSLAVKTAEGNEVPPCFASATISAYGQFSDLCQLDYSQGSPGNDPYSVSLIATQRHGVNNQKGHSMGKQAQSTKPGRLNVGSTSPARNTLEMPGMNGSVFAPNRFVVERIKVGPALDRSRVSTLHGRPFPVQFRNQGAFEAWKQALGTGEEWIRWAHPKTTCWEIRQEILWQLNNIRVYRSGSNAPDEQEQSNARTQAVPISANTIVRRDYAEAQKRIGGPGVKKRARLLQRMASLYNGILVVLAIFRPRPLPARAVMPSRRTGDVATQDAAIRAG